jgi:hypothetical protein
MARKPTVAEVESALFHRACGSTALRDAYKVQADGLIRLKPRPNHVRLQLEAFGRVLDCMTPARALRRWCTEAEFKCAAERAMQSLDDVPPAKLEAHLFAALA